MAFSASFVRKAAPARGAVSVFRTKRSTLGSRAGVSWCAAESALHRPCARLHATLAAISDAHLSVQTPLHKSQLHNVQVSSISCSAAAAAEPALQTPHGGELVSLSLPAADVDAAVASCTKTVECTDRQACDVELLSVGCARAPLTRSVATLALPRARTMRGTSSRNPPFGYT